MIIPYHTVSPRVLASTDRSVILDEAARPETVLVNKDSKPTRREVSLCPSKPASKTEREPIPFLPRRARSPRCLCQEFFSRPPSVRGEQIPWYFLQACFRCLHGRVNSVSICFTPFLRFFRGCAASWSRPSRPGLRPARSPLSQPAPPSGFSVFPPCFRFLHWCFLISFSDGES